MMDEWTGLAILAVGGSILLRWSARWWRNRKAGKQADELLANVLKGKDSFRR